MNLQQLRVFAAVARSKTLTEIASELNLKQPTVSFHLKKLEEELGVELFRKQMRHIRLTDMGESLLPYALRIISLVDEAELLVKEQREQGRGKLKIGASYTPATYFLPPYLASFQHDYPNVLPLLTVKKAGEILDLLQEYEIDVAIVSLPNVHREGLEIIRLTDDELKLLLPPQHPLSSKDQITLADLKDEPFLIHEKGSTSRELSEEWALENGFQCTIRMELGAIETIKESVKHHMGIGILPKRSVLREVNLGELVMRDLPGYINRRYISLAFRKEDLLSFHVRTFIQFMKEKCEEIN